MIYLIIGIIILLFYYSLGLYAIFNLNKKNYLKMFTIMIVPGLFLAIYIIIIGLEQF